MWLMWKLVALASLVLAALLLTIPQARADGEVSLRAEFYKPKLRTDGTYKWVLFQKCNQPGAPTVAVSGMASFRMVVYATNNFNGAGPRIATGDNGPDEWYQFYFPRLQAGVETQVADVVQDLKPGGVQALSTWVPGDPTTGDSCTLTYSSIPPNEGLISHRTTPTVLATNLRIQVETYADQIPIPCGSSLYAGRIRVTFWADAPAGALIDYHSHIEVGPHYATGPNQETQYVDRRFWETSMDDTPIQSSGVQPLGMVGEVVTPTDTSTPTTIHFAQQTPPGTPKNEVFCSFGPGV